jgi:hypothetical protein
MECRPDLKMLVRGRQLLVSAQLLLLPMGVVYIKRQLGIAPQVFVIKVTAAKNRN